jgi:hypothetical protein
LNLDLLNILGDVACVQDDFSYSRGEGLTIISGDQQLEKNHGSDCKKMVENVDSCAKILLNANGGAKFYDEIHGSPQAPPSLLEL